MATTSKVNVDEHNRQRSNKAIKVNKHRYIWDPFISNNAEEDLPPKFTHRIMTDLKAFFTDPIPNIMLAPDTNNIKIAHAIIIGPEDTPYEGGFFYFYIKFPYNYPMEPPLIKLMTTGRNTVRFNPNLYTNGKVCLSLLNTWPGTQWSPGSTLYSVLLCIQSIMNETHNNNEPSINSISGKFCDLGRNYYDVIRHETIRFAVIGMVEDDYDCKNMPSVLKEYITEYFKTKTSFYDKVIRTNMHLNGERMEDPYEENRGRFMYNTLELKINKLKDRLKQIEAENTNSNV